MDSIPFTRSNSFTRNYRLERSATPAQHSSPFFENVGVWLECCRERAGLYQENVRSLAPGDAMPASARRDAGERPYITLSRAAACAAGLRRH